MRTAILGSGSWGTALASLMAGKGFPVRLWGRDAAVAEAINRRRENTRYFPGRALPEGITAVTGLAEAMEEAELCILAIPCQSMREVARALPPLISDGLPLVCVSKGIELSTLKTMSGVVGEEAPKGRYAILSGPSFAAEVLDARPTAVVVGAKDALFGEFLREAFFTEAFRVYSATDVLGVELGGALKNVMAIAVGLSDGLNLGGNARAALITRALAEMGRLGLAMGAHGATFMGLSGLGDLVLTCTGDLSRNRRVGLSLAKGLSTDEIVNNLHMVAEGVKTTEAVVSLAEAHSVEMPISRVVRAVLKREIALDEAVRLLMTRELKMEFEGPR